MTKKSERIQKLINEYNFILRKLSTRLKYKYMGNFSELKFLTKEILAEHSYKVSQFNKIFRQEKHWERQKITHQYIRMLEDKPIKYQSVIVSFNEFTEDHKKAIQKITNILYDLQKELTKQNKGGYRR